MAFTAAEIALVESSGDANAVSPAGDFGLWQINDSYRAGHSRPARPQQGPPS